MREVGALYVGDSLKFSTELLQQLKEDGDRTQVVTVIKIVEQDDGLKVVHLGREQ